MITNDQRKHAEHTRRRTLVASAPRWPPRRVSACSACLRTSCSAGFNGRIVVTRWPACSASLSGISGAAVLARRTRSWPRSSSIAPGVTTTARRAGGVSFEGLTPESIGQHADVFEKAVRKLRGRVMPPPGARQPDAAAIDSLVAWLEESLDRAAEPGASAGPGRPAPAQSQGIRKRGPGSPGGRHRRDRAAAGRRHRRGLRQHRDGVAGVAVLHRAIRHRRARRRREGGRPAGCETGRVDVPRRTRHAAHARRRPSARHARRHSRESRSPVGRRIPHRRRRHGHPHLGQRHGVREPAGGDARQQARLRDGDRRRRRHEAVRSGAERRARSRQRPPEEHPLLRDRRTAQDRRRIQAPDVRRVRRSAADVRARRRPGSFVSRELLSAAGAVRREGAQPDAEPRANLQLPSGRATRERREALARRRSSRRSPGARTGGRCPPRT